MFADYVAKSIDADKRRLKHYRKLSETSVQGRLNCRFDKRTGKRHYYFKASGDFKEHYVKSKPNMTVWRIQQKRLAQEMVRVLSNNIKLKTDMCRMLENDSISEVIKKIPIAYRPNAIFQTKKEKKAIRQSENPYRREELKETTSFGLHVRTKGELAIAEFLYAMGIDFYYEKKLTLRVQRQENIDSRAGDENGGKRYFVWITKNYYPDFTIVLPSGEEVYWEHKGMLSIEKYTKRDIQKEIDYNINGIYQPRNLMVTAEGPDNDMDMEAIGRIVDGWLMPLLNI